MPSLVSPLIAFLTQTRWLNSGPTTVTLVWGAIVIAISLLGTANLSAGLFSRHVTIGDQRSAGRSAKIRPLPPAASKDTAPRGLVEPGHKLCRKYKADDLNGGLVSGYVRLSSDC